MLKVICFYGVDEKLAGQLNFLAKAALLSLLLPSLLNFDPILQEKESLWYQNKKKVKRHTNYPTAAVLQDNALQCDFRGSWKLKKSLKTLWIHPCLGFLLRLVRLGLLAFERIACSRCDRHLAGSGMFLASLRPNFAQLLPYLVPVPILLLPPLWFNFALGLLRRFLLSLSMIAIFGSFHDTFTTARLL